MLLLTSSICGLFFNNFLRKKNAALAMNGGLVHRNQVSALLGLEASLVKWVSSESCSKSDR